MLASLPKFPSTGNPISNPTRAIERRNYVLGRMLENRFIDQPSLRCGLIGRHRFPAHEPPVEVDAPYFAEMVRLEAMERLGNDALTDGYVVKTTLDSTRQEAANQALRGDLVTYDQRHGYRGAEAHVDLAADAGKTDWDKRARSTTTRSAGLVPGIVTESTHRRRGLSRRRPDGHARSRRSRLGAAAHRRRPPRRDAEARRATS